MRMLIYNRQDTETAECPSADERVNAACTHTGVAVSHEREGDSVICSNGGTPWKERHDQPRQHIQKQRHYFAD